MEITVNGEKVFLSKKSYGNKRIALSCTDVEGYPYGVLTTNLVDEVIGNDEAFLDTNNIPDSVNALKKANVISGDPIRYAQSGYCKYPLYKINI